jgi:hypothetical protein
MGINSDVIGQSYNLLFKNKTLLVLGILGAVISAIVTMIFVSPLTSLDSSAMPSLLDPAFWAGAAIGLVVVWIVSIFVTGLIISAASFDKKADYMSAVNKTLSRYVSLLGTSLVCGMVGIVAFVPSIALLVLGSLGGGIAATVIGFALLALGFYVVLRVSLSDVVCVVGGKGPVESVKASWAMTKGNLLSIFIVVLALSMIGGIAGGIVNYFNMPAGTFVNTLLAYPVTIAFVLIYKQLSGSSSKPTNRKKK